ncbi:MAG: hypothetical protein AB7I24_14560 [Candidatus Nanopelagicales bacterium]|jgi:hypothetical protein
MRRLITLTAGFAAGYVLGAKAGHERYEQIADKAASLWAGAREQVDARRAGSRRGRPDPAVDLTRRGEREDLSTVLAEMNGAQDDAAHTAMRREAAASSTVQDGASFSTAPR